MKKLIWHITLGFLPLLSPPINASAQELPQVSSELDTNHLLVGQQTSLELKAVLHASDSIIFPELNGDTITGKVEIISKGERDTVYGDDLTEKLIKQKIIITSFDSGYHALPPFQFVFNDDTLETAPLLLGVNLAKVDTSEAIKDIKAPVEIPFFLSDWLKNNWYWIAGIPALAIIAFLLYRYMKKRKEKPKQSPVKKAVEIPAHITALKRLNELKEKKLWQQGKIKEYHIELSETVRQYLKERFKINAPEQTTDEIMLNLRYAPLNEEDKHLLLRVLKLSDLVKFAKEVPMSSENQASMESALQFVERTKIVTRENESSNNNEVKTATNH